mgnify:CR=1 FL=1
MTCTKLGELERAEQVLEEAKRRSPFSSVVHIGLGMLSFEQGDYNSAYESFELAWRIEPDSKQARAGVVASLVNRAIELYKKGRDEQAVELLQAGADDYVMKDNMVRLAAAVTAVGVTAPRSPAGSSKSRRRRSSVTANSPRMSISSARARPKRA